MMTARPLSAAMIRAAGKPQASASNELSNLLSTLAETVVGVFKDFTSAPVRVEPDGIAISEREVPVPEGIATRIVSARGPLSPVLLADRMLVMALCEAAFGGSGTEAPYDGADRPYSPTECKLRDALLTALAAKLPEVLELCLALPFHQAEEEERKPRARNVVTMPFIAGRLLVYVFGYSGELTLLLPEDQANGVIAAARASSPITGAADSSAYVHTLQRAEVELTAMLPAEWMPLAEVASLRPGQLLKFQANVNTPLLVMAGDKLLHQARMAQGGEHVTIEISG